MVFCRPRFCGKFKFICIRSSACFISVFRLSAASFCFCERTYRCVPAWPHNITRSPVKYFHRLDHRPFPFGYSVNDVGNLYFNLLKTSSIMNKKCLPNSRLSLVFSAPPSSKCVSSRVSNVDFFRSFCKSSFIVDGIFTSIM